MSNNSEYYEISSLSKYSNPNLEASLLGLVYINNQTASKIIPYLTKEDFTVREHALFFEVLKDLFLKNISINFDQLMFYKSKNKQYSFINFEFLLHIQDSAGLSNNIIQYLQELERLTKLRTIELKLSRVLNKLSTNTAVSESEVISELHDLLLNIDKSKTSQDFLTVEEVAKVVVDDLVKKRELNISNISGVPSGFEALDTLTQGFQPGEMIVLAARPGMGKTAFALNIAKNASSASRNKPAKKVVFFTLEMPSSQLVTRLFGISTEIDLYKFKKPSELSQEELDKITIHQKRHLNQLNLFIDESAKTDLPTLLWKCRRLAKTNGIDMIIIDYLQLLSVDSSKPSRDRQAEVATISRNLKTLALELKVPIIALSQLSREVEKREDKRPILSDLRESGTIEQDADIVLFLYRKNYYNKNKINFKDKDLSAQQKEMLEQGFIGDVTNLLIAKHRNGTQADINLLFRLNCGKFEDLYYKYDEVNDSFNFNKGDE
ncbi:replicative DNA helicase [Mycoplasmopsis bovis]|uniref:Replicative DNA helicase n=4 Tax=Mycoplasmopsis bovis TaxID=28903 RepID=A0A2N8U1Z3_MYCBV|nr:replicative DNA helicase [Mycoplasmopsis bovis]AEI89971.1 replicative DNA helicase [Mycoplasmopsis bovis Hubei-1]AFM51646.1 replicative DNA helicase [Mycoplasmopsis bovis HB0801]AIA33846.1 replicative DNA helicase [Mycoplasmopsis bovis CQ-W70]AKO50473.1 DNA helicase [Mycoplasmopsis bovis]AMW24938.1 replicative DNA helicase [Mycoplasmopsis bovis]